MRSWTTVEERKLAQYLKEGKAIEECAVLLARTDHSIKHKKDELRVKGFKFANRKSGPKRGINMRRFTPEEDQYIREAYAAYVPVEIMAAKINRSWGTMRQRILKLGLTRDSRKTRLVKQYGADVLNLAPDVIEIRAIIASNMTYERKMAEAEEAARLQGVLNEAEANIWNKHMPREEAFAKAQDAGCTLESIGHRFGLTRERVRQLIARIRPRPDGLIGLTCTRCGDEFRARSANRKYCDDCGVAVSKEHRTIWEFKGGRSENKS